MSLSSYISLLVNLVYVVGLLGLCIKVVYIDSAMHNNRLLFGRIVFVVFVEAIARFLAALVVEEGADLHEQDKSVDKHDSHDDHKADPKGTENVLSLIELALNLTCVNCVLRVDALVDDHIAFVAIEAVISLAQGLINI